MTSTTLVDRAVILSVQMPKIANQLSVEYYRKHVLPAKESRALLIAAQELCAIVTSLDQFASGVVAPKIGP